MMNHGNQRNYLIRTKKKIDELNRAANVLKKENEYLKVNNEMQKQVSSLLENENRLKVENKL